MTQFCFNILRGVIEDAQHFITSTDVIKNYNILELIEKQSKNCLIIKFSIQYCFLLHQLLLGEPLATIKIFFIIL